MPKERDYLTKNDLAEFTEETLLPAVERIIDSKISTSNHDMKDYIDKKISSAKGDIISTIKLETLIQ